MSSSPLDLYTVHRYMRVKTGLPADAFGIVGDEDHTSGYHLGWDRVSKGKGLSDYSYAESPRDRAVKSNSASAMDIGLFSIGGRTLRGLSAFLVDACRREDPRARDIREIIYTLDGKNVLRWDRLNVRSSGDKTHLTHTHISFFRDSEGRRDLTDNFAGLIYEYFGDSQMTIPGAFDDYLPDTALAILNGTTPRLGYVSATGPAWDNEVVGKHNIASTEARINARFDVVEAKLRDVLAKLELLSQPTSVTADEIAKALIRNLSA